MSYFVPTLNMNMGLGTIKKNIGAVGGAVGAVGGITFFLNFSFSVRDVFPLL